MKQLKTIFISATAIISIAAVCFPAASQQREAPKQQNHVRIVAAGDLMQHTPQVNAALTAEGRYDYRESFRYVAERFRKADIAILNLETTLAEQGPYTGYPCFRSPSAVAEILRDMNIDMVAMANNHCCDRGGAGIESTTNILDKYGISRTGVYRDSIDYNINNINYIKRNGISFAVLNYTYGTNGIPIPEGKIVNLIDTVSMARDIAAIDRKKTDCIIVFLHWGNEYQRKPDALQKQTADFLRRHGVDLIIGSHPHVVQPYQCNASTGVTIYSLGNFVSNQRTRYSDGGIIATIDVTRNANGKFDYSVDITPVWVRHKDYAILPPEIGDTLTMTSAERQQYSTFMTDTRTLLQRK